MNRVSTAVTASLANTDREGTGTEDGEDDE
jgi:hypothetical protein